jgi:hypothetical protein
MGSDATALDNLSPLFILFIACRTGFSRIRFFREVAMAGRPIAGQEMFERHYGRMQELAKNDPPDVLERCGSLVSQMTFYVVTEAQASIDAASLVFAHSILDDIASECCSISFQAAPGEWAPTIEQRKVPLGQVKDRNYQQLLLSMGADYVEQLKHDPLMKRLDIINQHCQPTAAFSWKGQPYAYDRDRIQRLDDSRHAIVHAPSVGKSLPDIEEELSFLHATSQFIIWMVCERYRLHDELMRFGS